MRRSSSPAAKRRASPKRLASPGAERRSGRRSRSGSPVGRGSDAHEKAHEKAQAKQAILDFMLATGETESFAETVVGLLEKKDSLLRAYSTADKLMIAPGLVEDGARGNSTISEPPSLQRETSAVDVLSIFKSVDTNGDGIIEREELTTLFKHLDPAKWTDEELETLMALCDTNGDGRIQYEEFVNWTCSSTYAPYKSVFESAVVAMPKSPTVNAEVVKQFSTEAKLQIFEKLMSMYLPSWMLDKQWEKLKTDVVSMTLQPHSTTELFDIFATEDSESPFVARLWRDNLVKIVNEMDMFTCPVCTDPLITVPEYEVSGARSSWQAPVRRTEHWSNIPCGHQYCMDCMSTWVTAEINSMKTSIKCLAPDCTYRLWDQDVENVVSAEIFARYKEHKSADYAKKLAEAKADPELKRWLEKNARPCPDCHAIISRSTGCNMMKCTCGTAFCYGCGFKRCQCGVRPENRADIWKVD